MQRTFRTDSGETLRLQLTANSRLGIGGQGQVHTARINGERMAVKLMREVDAERLRALHALETACGAVATLPRQLLHESRSSRRGRTVGYAMRLVEQKRAVSAVHLFNFEQIRRLPHYTWADAVLAALRLAESVATLHRHGIVIGDLNPENVVYEATTTLAETASWRAILLDTDSFQIAGPHGRRHCCPVGRAPYTAPELVGRDLSRTWRQSSADDFALAVLIYQLLLHDHPYDNAINESEPDLAVNEKIRRGLYPHAAVVPVGLRPSPYRPAPSQISEAIDQAFRRSFYSPSSPRAAGVRPTAIEWVALLRDLHGQLMPCRRSRHHHHPRGRACLWCGVDKQVGQAISRFPNAFPQTTATPAAAPAPAVGITLTTAEIDLLLEQHGALHRQLLAHQQRVGWLVGWRGELSSRLLRLERELDDLHSRHGEVPQWIDRHALEHRLRSRRARLRRHLLGRGGSDAERHHSLQQLLSFIEGFVGEIFCKTAQLRQRSADLRSRLAALDLRALERELAPNGSDPAAAAITLLHAAAARQQEAWLRRQLEQETIRSWRIEGFGAGRLAVLEDHGVLHAEQLRRNIDRLTALPGIGKGIQAKLRDQLECTLARHRRQLASGGVPLELGDVIDSAAFARLPSVEEELQQLQHGVAEAETLHTRLNESIARQRAECDRRRDAFLAIS